MMSPMQKIVGQWLFSLKHYLYMCLLLSSPDRLPYSPYPVVVTGFLYFLLGLLLVDPERSYPLICAYICLELFLLGLIAWIGLMLKQAQQRFQQTFAALLGINMVITAVAIPVDGFVAAYSAADSYLQFYVELALIIWNLTVISLIFKRAFEVSTRLSAMITFCYFLVSQIIVYWLVS